MQFHEYSDFRDVAVIYSNDALGQSAIAAVSSLQAQYDVTVLASVPITSGATHYVNLTSALEPLLNPALGRLRLIWMLGPLNQDAVNVVTAALELGLIGKPGYQWFFLQSGVTSFAATAVPGISPLVCACILFIRLHHCKPVCCRRFNAPWRVALR
jgi:hypothetical protein